MAPSLAVVCVTPVSAVEYVTSDVPNMGLVAIIFKVKL